MVGKNKIRILVAKPGLDVHDRGAKLVAASLRDAGMEVIYTGFFQTPEAIINAAIQENVDLIGLSILSGSHIPLVSDLMEQLRLKEAGEIPVVLGGVIPPKDVPVLKELGVKEVFGPGTFIKKIVDLIEKIAG